MRIMTYRALTDCYGSMCPLAIIDSGVTFIAHFALHKIQIFAFARCLSVAGITAICVVSIMIEIDALFLWENDRVDTVLRII